LQWIIWANIWQCAWLWILIQNYQKLTDSSISVYILHQLLDSLWSSVGIRPCVKSMTNSGKWTNRSKCSTLGRNPRGRITTCILAEKMLGIDMK
jgi:hypothetical protein